MDHVTSLTDGSSLTKALHDKGIGMRYLGKIVPMMEGKPSLVHIHVSCSQTSYATWWSNLLWLIENRAFRSFIEIHKTRDEILFTRTRSEFDSGRNRAFLQLFTYHLFIASTYTYRWLFIRVIPFHRLLISSSLTLLHLHLVVKRRRSFAARKLLFP